MRGGAFSGSWVPIGLAPVVSTDEFPSSALVTHPGTRFWA